jgi:hypothetical protein
MRILAALILLAMISVHVRSADPSSEVKKLLEKLEKSSNAEYRSNICMGLAELGPKASSAIPRLLEIAEQDLNNGTRRCAIFALGEIGDASTAKQLIALSKNHYKNNEILLQLIAFHLDRSNKEYQKIIQEHVSEINYGMDYFETVTLIIQNKVKFEKKKTDTLMKSMAMSLYSRNLPKGFLTQDLDRHKYTANINPLTMKIISIKASALLAKYLLNFDTEVRNDDKENSEEDIVEQILNMQFSLVKEDFFTLLCQNITIDELRSIHLSRADKQKPTDFDLSKIVAQLESGKSHEYWIKLLNDGKPNERRLAMKVLIAIVDYGEKATLLPDFSKYEHDKDEVIAALAVRGLNATKLKK